MAKQKAPDARRMIIVKKGVHYVETVYLFSAGSLDPGARVLVAMNGDKKRSWMTKSVP
ncbi:hypothetical protein [Pelovirga terrestris]|uniref:Uncharacterized protein n=1 Tax=Pelovirga terrestris TaxID=2771352 RepID=A0A8J6QY46_9BACT|nr:hypothetical protein [Pelovirga terrestris]MBD1400602.1 hypothetical protein [Pelovirga terrestris]